MADQKKKKWKYPKWKPVTPEEMNRGPVRIYEVEEPSKLSGSGNEHHLFRRRADAEEFRRRTAGAGWVCMSEVSWEHPNGTPPTLAVDD